MDIKIRPRKENEQGGIACLPLARNLPANTLENHTDWELVECTKCDSDCYLTPLAKEQIQNNKVTGLCTQCALQQSFNREV